MATTARGRFPEEGEPGILPRKPSPRFRIEVYVRVGYADTTGKPVHAWRAMHPTGGAPYEWATRDEAERARESAYQGLTLETVRVVEVK